MGESRSSGKSVTVHLPEEVYEKLADCASRMQLDPETMATEFIMDGLGLSHSTG